MDEATLSPPVSGDALPPHIVALAAELLPSFEDRGEGYDKTVAVLRAVAALSLPADGWQTKEADRDFTLEWIAAPRPPVHPEPMRGVQSFKSREAANRFAANLAEDAIIVSLVENVTHRRPLTSTPEQGK